MNLDETNAFINALQLSINTEIANIVRVSTNESTITFSDNLKDDFRLELFQKLVPGVWNASHLSYTIQNFSSFNIPLITQFLLLTRLKKENIVKLAELDDKYRDFAKKILGPTEDSGDKKSLSMPQITQMIFDKVAEKKITLRELSHATDLSMVALSNFKAGNDIRLSNLIKICEALELKIKLSPA